jgi:hypothetical protein
MDEIEDENELEVEIGNAIAAFAGSVDDEDVEEEMEKLIVQDADDFDKMLPDDVPEGGLEILPLPVAPSGNLEEMRKNAKEEKEEKEEESVENQRVAVAA